MADNQQQAKKQFSVPSRDELIQQIKQLDQDIEHVTLNLIKCDFNATQKDVEKAFPDITFLKVKNYNPGSFQIVFQMKIDAMNFIRNHYDKKILSRRFFIKMGRQQKELVEQWTGVGFVPKSFKGPHKQHQNRDAQGGNKRNKKPEESKTQQIGQKSQQKIETQVIKEQQIKQEIKQNDKHQQQAHKEQKREGKHIPKGNIYPKKQGYHKKPYTKQVQGATKPVEGTEKPIKVPTEQTQVVKKPDQKVQQQQVPKQKGQVKKQQKKVEPVKQPETKEQTKEQDDGWIVVGKKPNNKRR